MKTKRFRGVATSLECQRCHKRALIRRAPDSKRKEGHIKHLFCVKCKITTAHEEVRSVRSMRDKKGIISDLFPEDNLDNQSKP